MSFGLKTFDASGNVIITSPTEEVAFYAGRNSVGSSDFTPAFTGYSELKSVVTRQTEYTTAAYIAGRFILAGSNYTRTICQIYTTGVVSNGIYYAPSRYETLSGGWSGTLDFDRYKAGLKVSTLAGYQYSFGTLSNNQLGYGMAVYNESNNVVVTTNAAPLYIQPTTTGGLTKTATASSVGVAQSTFLTKFDNVRYFTFSETTSTITFDKAYVKPPLIFLTNSNGIPVAIWGYNKNASGLFTGVTLTTSGTPSGTVPTDVPYQYIGNSFWGFKNSQSTTVEVMVVSDEYPDYISDTSWGVQTFNASGDVTFDSRISIAGVNTSNRSIPYWRSRIVDNGSSAAFYKDQLNTTSWTESGLNRAVCLNSFQAVTGFLSEIVNSERVNQGEAQYMNNFYGRYVSASKVSGNTFFKIEAGGTGYFGYSYIFNLDFNSTNIGEKYPTGSIDAHLGRTSTFDVITTNW